ncbi:hypothetical protein M422DRAFT_178669 [Sphaerobolus stellatus SS14]|uniref:FAD/NAD(P)-binding domain-containing protein n=1 Tax=Sphaerobolus stellatus (strain SS14) TaxID=990650 RepID=A0A0C9VHG5_SPHS4|nr:hypothetical protein M422DRAFT_178669 [Sphaerobolus stellatus SS14]
MGAQTRICIIGGGAAGLGVLKILKDSPEFQADKWEIAVFESRDNIGGVWYPSPPEGNPPASPMYDALTTNLPHPLMAYSSFWFEPSTPLFPVKDVVLEYIRRYADHFDLKRYIRLNTRVEKAIWSDASWKVTLSDGNTHIFDKVIVANGHYGVPRHPNIPGVEQWLKSGRASHSVFFRNEKAYHDQTLLVVGNGPSGMDICAEVGPVAKTLYHSVTGGTPRDVGNVRHRGRVVSLQDDGTVLFDDGGPPSDVIDHAILATGYVMSFPFLPQVKEGSVSSVPPLPKHLHNTSYSVFPLARHLFPLQDDFSPTSLAFVGLPIRVAPLPLFEAQAHYISEIFRNEEAFDTSHESQLILSRYSRLREQFNDNLMLVMRYWDFIPEEQQFAYRRQLLDIAHAPQEYYPEEWTMKIYENKNVLRAKWRQLEKEGKARDVVRGVGEKGRQDWVDLMKRMLEGG